MEHFANADRFGPLLEFGFAVFAFMGASMAFALFFLMRHGWSAEKSWPFPMMLGPLATMQHHWDHSPPVTSSGNAAFAAFRERLRAAQDRDAFDAFLAEMSSTRRKRDT